MGNPVTVRGTLVVDPESVIGGCGVADHTSRQLQLLNETEQFQSVAHQSEVAVQTTGNVGDEYQDVDCFRDFVAIELLRVRAKSRIGLRIGADEPKLDGSGGTFPTNFAGSETLDLDIEGTTFTTTFDAADQSAADVVARINAAAALAGLSTPRASVLSSGQIRITGITTGNDAIVRVTGGTGAATLGFGGAPEARGEGADVEVHGEYLQQFPRSPNAPARVQVSGNATISVVVAGRTTS